MWTTLSILGLNALTGLCKKWIKPKWGEVGVHAFIFVIALIGTGIYQLYTKSFEVKMLIEQSAVYLMAAVALYEIILKKIFK